MGRKSLVQIYNEADKTKLLQKRVRPIEQAGLLQETDEFIEEMTEALDCNRDNLTAKNLNTNKVTKAQLSTWLEEALKLFTKQAEMIRDLQSVVDISKNELILSQRDLIKMKDELLDCKNEQLKSFQAEIKSTVHDSVESEIRSFSSVLQSIPSPASAPVDTANIKDAVRHAIVEEDRTRNVFIYGLEEDNEEQIFDTVSSLFEELGEKPRVDACRIGKSGNVAVPRPVKVVLSSSTVARQILVKAKGLRRVERFKKVYICPDRSAEERQARKALVVDLKQRIVNEPNRRHYIKGDQIVSEGKT